MKGKAGAGSDDPADCRPGAGRYARLEREQRWLLSSLPDGTTMVARLFDHYLTGTTLRLRRMTTDQGVVYKLGQKVRPDPQDPERNMLTTIYLTSDEHSIFAALPGHSVLKTRHHFRLDGTLFAIDQFEGRHAPLLLAETELAEGFPLLPLPDFAVKEVTHEDRYTGAALAEASDADIQELAKGIH